MNLDRSSRPSNHYAVEAANSGAELVRRSCIGTTSAASCALRIARERPKMSLIGGHIPHVKKL